MGAGKTTLAKRLANKINYKFIDLDKYIEDYTGNSISHLFANGGEINFRKIESECLKKAIQLSNNLVISVGGGTPCFNKNMDLINKNSTSIYLRVNEGMLFSRLQNSKSGRPLIANKSDDELKLIIKELLAERETFYNQSQIIIDAKNISVEDIVKRLDLK